MTEEPEPAIGCIAEVWLLWLGAGGLCACAFLRVYRSHSVLIRHNGFMWSVLLQLAVVLVPFLIPPTFFTVRTDLVAFDQDTLECERQSEGSEAFALGVIVILAVCTAALTCRLPRVRFQVQYHSNGLSRVVC